MPFSAELGAILGVAFAVFSGLAVFAFALGVHAEKIRHCQLSVAESKVTVSAIFARLDSIDGRLSRQEGRRAARDEKGDP